MLDSRSTVRRPTPICTYQVGHALYLYGLLIPVRDLVNGRNVIADQYADALTLDYFHIELEDHDVVLAEGAAAETYGGGLIATASTTPRNTRDCMAQPSGPSGASHQSSAIFGGRRELVSRLRSAISPLYDARQPLDRIRDHIASRADLGIAA